VPCVSIGIPVYNGEKHLSKAIESILAQTYQDFEIIISNNASTDGTDEICRDFARSDRRIRHFLQSENLGAARNFNIVFELSRGKYFKWTGYDDWLAPEFLARCVTVLDNDPSLALCYCHEGHYSRDGCFVCSLDQPHNVTSSRAATRFRQMLWSRSSIDLTYAVVRRRALLETSLISTLLGADDILAAELSLAGRFAHINERISFRTAQPRADEERMDRIEPSPKSTRCQFTRACIEYARIIKRAKLKVSERTMLLIDLAAFFSCAQIRRRVLGLDGGRVCPESLRRVHNGLYEMKTGGSKDAA